jgi:hypothetical protein
MHVAELVQFSRCLSGIVRTDVDFGGRRRGEPGLPKLVKVRAPMATGTEISGNKDRHDQRLDFGWCSLASEPLGGGLARLPKTSAFIDATLCVPASSLRQHSPERVVTTPEMVVKRRRGMKRDHA